MNNKSEGVLVRYLKGEIPLSTSFGLVFVPVFVVLIFGARPIGALFGGLSAKYDISLELVLFLMILVSLVVALVVAYGTGASAWKVRGLYGNLALIVVLLVGGSYLFGALKLLAVFACF